MSRPTAAPPVRPAIPWTFPAARTTYLSNGLRALTYHCPGQHVIAATLYVDVPLSVEPRDLEGVAGLTGRCLTQGATGRTSEQFADALALCGADLDAAASPDGFSVRLVVPTTHLEAGLQLMADAVRSPTFDADEFDHEKTLRLQEIDQARAYPQHVAVELLNAALFGSSRAARPIGGDTATVQAVQRDDVVAYAERYLAPGRATLIVAGDFDGTDPLPGLEAAFGGWQGEDPAVTCAEVPTVSDEPTIILVDWPDAPQATLRFAGPGISRSDERWAPLFVANFSVGGTFSSRINSVLREQKGVTYGASSSLDTARGAGLVTVSSAVRTDATADSVSDVVEILREVVAGGLTDDEVATGVRATSESAPLGFERAEAVVSRVELLLAQGLPLDHVDVNLARIRAVTRAEAEQAYREVVDPERLTVVVVGDAGAVEAELADLGYAPVQRRQPPAASPHA